MGLLSFIKDAGEKLFGKKEEAVDPAAANAKAAEAIAKYIEAQNLGVSGLNVEFDGASGAVTVAGNAPNQEAADKVTLCCGNVASVAAVNNIMTVSDTTGAGSFHDVESGDTLSAIAKKVYGDANKYMVIFEANKPMLSHPDKIYPGQKLRIPAL